MAMVSVLREELPVQFRWCSDAGELVGVSSIWEVDGRTWLEKLLGWRRENATPRINEEFRFYSAGANIWTMDGEPVDDLLHNGVLILPDRGTFEPGPNWIVTANRTRITNPRHRENAARIVWFVEGDPLSVGTCDSP